MSKVYIEEFVKQLSVKNRRPQRFYQDALREILKGVQEQISKGNEVNLTGFGVFYTRTHKGGKGRNFKTGETVEYKSVRLAAFRPGLTLKKAVRRRKV